KYFLCKRKLKFLGYVVSAQGILMNPEKVQAIKGFHISKNLRQLRGFL
ncbi:20732_t:CDS:1, partial [Dentiscutata erythropus]